MVNAIIQVLSRVLIPMFLVGMAGSAIVVAVTLVRDIHDFLTDDGAADTPVESLH